MLNNQLEAFQAAMAHEKHDQTLFYAGFTPDLEKRVRKQLEIADQVSLDEYFGMYTPVDVSMKPPANWKPADFQSYFTGMSIPKEAWISSNGVLEIPGSMYHFTRYVSPLRDATTLNEIEDFPYPNVEGYSDGHMKEAVDRAHRNNLVAFGSIVHMYEEAWQIRGYTEFLMDMIENPEICEYILDKITARNMTKAVAAARAGVDYLFTGDDVANQRDLMFSADMWRRFIKPRWAKVYQAARAIKPDIQVWYHSDGNIEQIIPELIEIGVTILNPVQPECMDPVSLKKKYGKFLVFDPTFLTLLT
jgi:uroporphyrinogen decarboxylase